MLAIKSNIYYTTSIELGALACHDTLTNFKL